MAFRRFFLSQIALFGNFFKNLLSFACISWFPMCFVCVNVWFLCIFFSIFFVVIILLIFCLFSREDLELGEVGRSGSRQKKRNSD